MASLLTVGFHSGSDEKRIFFLKYAEVIITGSYHDSCCRLARALWASSFVVNEASRMSEKEKAWLGVQEMTREMSFEFPLSGEYGNPVCTEKIIA
jgi:hypothetical protein